MLLETNNIIIKGEDGSWLWDYSDKSTIWKVSSSSKRYMKCFVTWEGTRARKQFFVIAIIDISIPSITLALYNSEKDFKERKMAITSKKFKISDTSIISYKEIDINIRYLIKDYINKMY